MLMVVALPGATRRPLERGGFRFMLTFLIALCASTTLTSTLVSATRHSPSHIIIDLNDRAAATSVETNSPVPWLVAMDELRHWADVLLDDKAWTTSATFVKLRNALAYSGGGHAAVDGDLHGADEARKLTLFDQILNDLISSPYRTMVLEASQADLNDDEEEDHHHHREDMDSSHATIHLDPATVTIAFEVGACAGTTTRKLHIDFGGCVPSSSSPSAASLHVNADEYLESTTFSPLRLATAWVADEGGFRSCDRLCKDGVVRIAEYWALGVGVSSSFFGLLLIFL